MKMLQPFHLVTLSPWPLLMSFSLMIMMISMINLFNNKIMFLMMISLMNLIFCLIQWWRDVIRESLFQGYHTKYVMKSLKLGMILFIISEIFFFLSIFWCYLHMFLSPAMEIGNNWPPLNILMFNPYLIPLLNTIILLSSGITITWSHYSIFMKKKFLSILSLFITIMLGLIFTMFQLYEYINCSFSMSDSVFGSIFFMSTGFHGLHVIVGSFFLLVNLIRMIFNNFSSIHHLGFEMAAWYWHFVDIVWLFLYMLIYLFI